MLIDAKKAGLVPLVAPQIQALLDLEPPFFMDEQLVADVLGRIGETGAAIRRRRVPKR